MRSLTVALILAALLGAGCAAPSPSPSPATGLTLRVDFTQGIPPVMRFSEIPATTITEDRIVVTAAPFPAIFPGPLVPPLTGRQISEEGLATIGKAARDLGLLTGQTDFTGGSKPGELLGRIRMTVGGQTVELIGNPLRVMQCITTPCEPVPGTPEAFGTFYQRLADLPSWLASELGPEAPWQPETYAILVGPAPDPHGMPQPPADWPLDAPLATLGAPISETQRCATIGGEDAALLRPALQAATQITAWTQDPSTSATFGLIVRPLLPGEDVCRDLFGGG